MARPPCLCDTCRHHKLIRSARGSEFLFCLRSKDDPQYPKYPPLPVVRCHGFEQELHTDEPDPDDRSPTEPKES